MEKERFVFDLESAEWVSPGPGVRYKAASHGNRQVRLVEFGTEFREDDWCRKAHAGYVLSGECVLDFEDSRRWLKAGDGFIIPGGDSGRHMLSVPQGVVRLFLVEDL